MINLNKLRGRIAEQGLTQGEVAKALGISRNTWLRRMRTGIFMNTEMDVLIEILGIENPQTIFFAHLVA
ncbi:MAG: hypothetical protein LBJ12_07785 [Oscillospiraceae bacterium]|jgi:transcriptional regulator with XRE-family HTH domain|nr:hypothetical protein [Oscillospiraceae bacterium]